MHHPNIVKLFGHFEDNNYIYFIMEYIKKGNVDDLISFDKKKRNSAQICASIIKDVICAVYFLHNMKPPIINIDIKPENVLLSEGSVAKLECFSFKNYIIEECDSRKNVNACSKHIYFAPEILQDKEPDEAADIWRIGVLLFELVTGTFPFQYHDISSVIENILRVKISWPKDINTDAKNLIMKILRKYPKQRLPLEDMLKHPFIAKYFPDTTKYLIKPEEGVQYKPFIVCKDDPVKPNNDKTKIEYNKNISLLIKENEEYKNKISNLENYIKQLERKLQEKDNKINEKKEKIEELINKIKVFENNSNNYSVNDKILELENELNKFKSYYCLSPRRKINIS